MYEQEAEYILAHGHYSGGLYTEGGTMYSGESRTYISVYNKTKNVMDAFEREKGSMG